MKNVVGGSKTLLLLPVLACAAIVSAYATSQDAQKPAPVPEIVPGFLVGYIPVKTWPNSFLVLPAPPAAGSAAHGLDDDVAKRSFAMRGTPRWTQAISDAGLRFPHQGETFSCALNAPITETDTPFLYQLLRRTLTDAGEATYAAKNHYNRPRPFLSNKQPICTPEEQEGLAKEGSYPSGHTAVGWAQALILSEISPDQQDAILKRGLSFGESRNVCNAHWYSDVLNGRTMAAATVARLHSIPEFLSDLAKAKAELAAVRAKGLKPSRDCVAEAAALGQQPPLWQ
jgi:acid phosphatase (class A)